MSASDTLMPNSEQPSTTQTYKIDIVSDAEFSKDAQHVDATPSSKLIGLTKDQLEQYRNVPFRKSVRYALFVLFGLAVVVGAILVVVLSPKCVSKKEPKAHQNDVFYQLYTPTFRDTAGDTVGDFKGIEEKIDDLRIWIRINWIWPCPVVQTASFVFKPEAVVDHMRVDHRWGSEEDLKDLIRATHAAGLYFIVDLPLTVEPYRRRPWGPPGATLNILSNSSLLDINVPAIGDGLLKAAARYFEWGVDGLHLSESGHANGTRKNEADHIERLASRIRKISANFTQFADKDVMIFADSVHRGDKAIVNSSIDYFMHSLIDGDKCNGAEILNCLEATIKEGMAHVENNAVPPLWNVADVDLPRVDEKFPSREHQEEVASLVTMVQLFLPGPVSILYGEEMALPSNTKGTHRQRGLMRWSFDSATRNFGFTSVNGPLFFKTVDDATGANVNFQSQYGNKLSPLTAFRLLSNLRFRDEIFREGHFESMKKDGLRVYKRFVDNPLEKVYAYASLLLFCMMICKQFCQYLNLYCFKLRPREETRLANSIANGATAQRSTSRQRRSGGVKAN